MWVNYLVDRLNTKNHNGHIDANKLGEALDKLNGGEAHHCVFDLDHGSLAFDEQGRRTFKGYSGPSRLAMGLIPFDFDSDDLGITAQADARGFLAWLGVSQAFVAFSGNKGFHIMIPSGYFGIDESTLGVPEKLTTLALALELKFPSIDTSIYSANHKIRALNSKHPKSNLYKTIVDIDWSMEEIREFCRVKRAESKIDVDSDLVSVREKLVSALCAPRTRAKKVGSVRGGAGSRNNTLKKIVGGYIKDGKSIGESVSAILVADKAYYPSRCLFSDASEFPGLSEHEAASKFVSSIFNTAKARTGSVAVVAESAVWVKALGYDDGHFYYISSRSKVMFKLAPNHHTPAYFRSFMTDDEWMQACPECVSEVEREGKGGAKFTAMVIVWSMVENHLKSMARAKGLFNIDNVRGTGVFKDNGDIVVNLGSRLFVNESFRAIDSFNKTHKYHYLNDVEKDVGIDVDDVLSVGEGRRIIDTFRLLRFKDPSHYIYLTGWIAASCLGAYLNWRPHLWLTGERGCGKTAILNYMTNMSAFGLSVVNSTAAGLKQTTKSNSIVVFYDESESEDKHSREMMRQVITFARQCSSRTSGASLRGTSGGEAKNYSNNAMFCFASIQCALLTNADESRILKVEFSHTADQSIEEYRLIERGMYEIEKLKSKLFAYMITHRDVFDKSVVVIKDTMRVQGFESRQADQVGALLAGYGLLLGEDVVTKDFVLGVLEELDFGDSEYNQDVSESDSVKCLDAVLEIMIRSRDSVATVSQLIEQGLDSHSPGYKTPDMKILETYGIRYMFKTGELAIQSKSTFLRKALIDTPYADGYASLLKRHEDYLGERTVRIGGRVRKSVVLGLKSPVT